jgi:hypothetical protein
MNQISKHQAYRSRTKARAIALKGGKCERCGFADERALGFHQAATCGRASLVLEQRKFRKSFPPSLTPARPLTSTSS